jgi:hypothetical protein
MGWLMLICSKSRNLSYAAIFFISVGTYPTVIIAQVWLKNNTLGFTKKGVRFLGL